MLEILRSGASRSFAQGPFKIRRIRPGAVLGNGADPAFGPLSVIDHANLEVGTVVALHEHVNDEILSYMWRGSMVHVDSSGNRITLSAKKLMMMNAGRSFWHEEAAPYVPVEMLQIFIRPREADLTGKVQFYERKNGLVSGGWHLIAGHEGTDAPLTIRQKVEVYDALLNKSEDLPAPSAAGMAQWLYVVDGAISLGGEELSKGDAAADIDGNLPPFRAERDATSLVIFLVDRSAPASRAGTISGR